MAAAEDIVSIPLTRHNTGQVWGFKIQGGADIGLPLYFAQISSNSLAGKAGIRNGDAILQLGERDVSKYTQTLIKGELNRAGNDIILVIQRNVVDVAAAQYKEKAPENVEVLEENTIQMNEDGEPYQEVTSETTKNLEHELSKSEAERGPRPASVFDRNKGKRSGYLNAQGVSYNRAYGRPT